MLTQACRGGRSAGRIRYAPSPFLRRWYEVQVTLHSRFHLYAFATKRVHARGTQTLRDPHSGQHTAIFSKDLAFISHSRLSRAGSRMLTRLGRHVGVLAVGQPLLHAQKPAFLSQRAILRRGSRPSS